jgi:hypothetical protein
MPSGIGDTVKSIWEKVKSIWEKVKDIPGSLSAAARKRSADVVAVGNKAAATVAAAKDSVVESLELLEFWVQTYRRWNPRPFQAKLGTFLNDAFGLPGEVSRVLVGVELRIPTDVAEKIVAVLPKSALYGLSQGLDTMPGWEKTTGELLSAARHVPTLTELNDAACRQMLVEEDVHKAIQRADQLVTLLIPTLELAIRHLPRDLSVDVSVVGEGGGTEVAGHPAKIPLEWAKWSVEMADKVFKKYLEFYGACKAAAAAKEDAAWKADVSKRLAEIEGRLPASS